LTNTVDAQAAAAEDRRVLRRMARGETTALAELYDAHARGVYTLALRIVSNVSDAEDVVQEVFTQAWRQASRYDVGRATVIGWLLMMTRARAIDHLRARTARPDGVIGTALPDMPSPEPGQETAALSNETVTRLRNALGELGESFRRPIELAYFEGLTQTAIAERLGEPLGTVKSRMRTALTRLRALMYDEGR